MDDEGERSHGRRDDTARTRRTLSSVRNAARLLKEFSLREPELGVTELSSRLGIGKSTVHRLLATLLNEDFVEQDPITGRYRPAWRSTTLAVPCRRAATCMPRSCCR